MIGSFLVRLGRSIASKFSKSGWARPILVKSPGPPSTANLPYEVLDHDQRKIRLLTLHRGIRGSPILCQLSQVKLDSGERYEALSYRWASQGPPRIVNLNNGTMFPVQQNLWSALDAFRMPNDDRKLWVDQISINQSDDTEKSFQVRLMGAIYGQAKQVLIWLGPGDEDTSLAIDSLQKFQDGHPETTKALRIRHSRHWRAVMKLVEDPYWNRLWIIQEIAHASQRLICCGDDTLSWDAFCFFLRSQRSGIVQRSRAVPAIDRQNLVVVRPAPAVALTRLSLDRALLTQLVQFRYAQQTDPRDKIYAFSTLTNDLGIFPDYTKSVQEVYLNSTVAHIRRYRSLNIVCQSYFTEDRLRLPSWVPDWTMVSGPRPLLYDTYGRGQGLTDLKTKMSDVEVDIEQGILHVRGLHIDTVRSLRGPLEEVADISSCLGDWASALTSLATGPGARQDLTQSYSSAMQQMSLATSSRPKRGPDGRSSKYNLPELWLVGDNLQLVNHLSKIVFRRRLFLTEDSWWGVGPSNAQEGDSLCLLQGCDLPVLLRYRDGHHVFVGEVDIHPAAAYARMVEAFVGSKETLKDFSLH